VVVPILAVVVQFILVILTMDVADAAQIVGVRVAGTSTESSTKLNAPSVIRTVIVTLVNTAHLLGILAMHAIAAVKLAQHMDLVVVPHATWAVIWRRTGHGLVPAPVKTVTSRARLATGNGATTV